MSSMYRLLNMHADASNMDVLRAAYKRIRRRKSNMKPEFREARHDLYRRLLYDHRKARGLWEMFR